MTQHKTCGGVAVRLEAPWVKLALLTAFPEYLATWSIWPAGRTSGRVVRAGSGQHPDRTADHKIEGVSGQLLDKAQILPRALRARATPVCARAQHAHLRARA